MTPANIINILASSAWQLKTEASPALQPDGVVVRAIKGIEQSAVAEVVEWLRLYTDPKNGTTRRCYVDDPVAGADPLPGRWRGGEVKWTKDPEDPKGPALIQQVLYRGLLTTLDVKDARLIAGRNLAGDGTNAQEDYVEVKWVGVDPDTAYALAAAQVTAAEVNALAHHKFVHDTDTVSLGTGWYHRDTLCAPREDGSFEITWRLHKPRFTLDGYADTATTRAKAYVYYFNVPKQLAQTVINAWLAAHPVGADARPSYNTESAVCDIICSYRKLDAAIHLTGILTDDSCDSSTTTAYHYGLPQNQIESYQVGTLSAGQEGSRQVRDNGDGTWDVVIAITTRKLRDIPAYSAEEDAGSQTERKEWKGVTNLEALASALDTNLAGKRVVVRIESTKDCSKDIARDTETPKDQDHVSYEVDAAGTTVRTVDTVASAAVTSPTPSDGQMVSAASRETPFGFRNETEVKTITDQTIAAGEVRADVTTTDEEHTAAVAALTPPTPADGEAVEYQTAPTQFKNRHRTKVSRKAVTDQTIAAGEVRADVTTTDEEHTAAVAALTPPTPADGEAVEYQTAPTQFKNRHRTKVSRKAVTDQTIAAGEVRADVTTTDEEHTAAVAALTPPTPADGEAVEYQTAPTQFKNRHRTKVSRKAVTDQTIAAGEVRADVTTTDEEHTAAVAALTPPTPADGEAVEYQTAPTQFKNRHRTKVSRKAVTDQTIAAGEVRADVTTTDEEHTAAVAALTPPTPADGEAVEYQTAPTQFKNRHRTKVSRRAITDQTIARGEVRADQTTAEEEHTAAATPQAAPTPADGEAVDYESSPTPYKNRHRTKVTRKTIINQTITEKEITAAGTRSVTINTAAATAEALPSSHTPGIRRRVRNDGTPYKNRHQTLVEEEVRTADALSVPVHVHVRTPDYEESVTIYEDSATDPALGGSDYGVCVKAKDPVTGRWNGRVGVRTYATSFSSRGDWESGDDYYNLGNHTTVGTVVIRIVRAFSKTAAAVAFDAPTGTYSAYYRRPLAAGKETYIRRLGPGKWEAQQVLTSVAP